MGGEEAPLRFAVLDCEDAAKWDGHAIALSRLLSLAGERWEHFRCWNDERPATSELHTYAGLVITGSHHGCNDALPWIANLRLFLRTVVDVHPSVKVLATCFGHQLMAQALGGAAGPNPHGAFVLRRESMTCEDAMLAREDFQAAAAMFPPIESQSSGLRRVGVLESHGDCVSSLPPNATLLASSPTAEFECFSVGDTVLSWQGHPELSSAAMERKILPYVESLSDDDKKASRASWKVENDALLLVAMARGFLRGGICGGDDADTVRAHFASADALMTGPSADEGYRKTVKSLPGASGDTSLADAAEATFLKVADAMHADVNAVAEEFRHLGEMHTRAGAVYKELGEKVGTAHVFADKVRGAEDAIAPQLEKLGEIEASVGRLEKVAAVLDTRARELEKRFARVVNGEVGDGG